MGDIWMNLVWDQVSAVTLRNWPGHCPGERDKGINSDWQFLSWVTVPSPAGAALGEGEDEQVWRKRMRPILDTVAFKMCPL